MLPNRELYSERANEYAAHSEVSPHNAYYERPAMLARIGDPTGKAILDLGCGAAPLLRQLSNRGAKRLVGIELSEGLANIARSKSSSDIVIINSDMRGGLERLGDQRFDVVVASLVFDYVDRLTQLFGLIASVLHDDGRLLFSIGMPSRIRGKEFVGSEVWLSFGITVKTYDRSMSSIEHGLKRSGFSIEGWEQPKPLRELLPIDPGAFTRIKTNPPFLFVDAKRGG
jgi:predicted TPR repeat methyltransferase